MVHRSDGSGTTYIWTDYLSKISSDWQGTTGKGTSVKWPVGVGGKGNEGVAGMIRQLPGSIGYIELIYAVQNKIHYGEREELVRPVHQGQPGEHDGGRSRGEDAGGFPSIDHQLRRPRLHIPSPASRGC